MISSMTSFFVGTEETKLGSLVIEIKTLNSRYFELQLKLNDDLRVFESNLRKKISKVIHRGKVDCKVYIKIDDQDTNLSKIDLNHVKKLINITERISSLIKAPQPINPLELLRLASEKRNTINVKAIDKALIKFMDHSLGELLIDRQREGIKIRKTILVKLNMIEGVVKQIKKLLPRVIKSHQKKIENKFKNALINIEEDRLKQELLIFIQKGDVEEELDRLESHIVELRRLLDLSEPVGKKIDFLMQEFNREANTLGSKSISVEISQASVNLKVLIEQIREQIQNIE